MAEPFLCTMGGSPAGTVGSGKGEEMKAFIAGLVLGAGLLSGGIIFYFTSGRAPVAVADPPMPFEKLIAHGALHARIEKEAVRDPPIAPDEPNLTAGVAVYVENCSVCHGLPGKPRTSIAMGLYPAAPALFEGTGVTDDPPSETYWKASNGIRLTGMPGFRGRLTDTQLWQVSQLLAHANALPEGAKKALASAP
jgi:mono/diheme cytochrome c family protein